jgi:hypothetical protein
MQGVEIGGRRGRERVMRSTFRLLAVLSFIAAASFGFAAQPASAAVVAQRFEEVSYEVNTCTGETVHLEGSYLLTVRTFGDDGFAVRSTYTLTGTGDSTGLRYTVNVQSAFTLSDADTNFESTFRARMISRGPAPDQWVLAHISTDPDDEDHITTLCRA